MQDERGPRKPKLHPPASKLHHDAFTSRYHRDAYSTYLGTPQHELAAQILLVAVKQARCSDGFGVLDRTSQNAVLAHVWGPLFMLRAAHWPSDALCVLPGAQNTFRHFRQLKMDPSELEMVENLLLCRGDLIPGKDQQSVAEMVQGGTMRRLEVSGYYRFWFLHENVSVVSVTTYFHKVRS